MDTMFRLVVIGCGQVFARHHLPAIRATPGVSLVGACEIDGDRRAWAETVLGDARCFETADRLFDEIEAEAVLVTTPPAMHAAALEICLKQGRSVLVEKPMTLTTGDAQRVLEEQRRSGKTVRVGFNRRFRRSYAQLRDRVQAGGEIFRVDFTFIADARRWNPASAEVSSPERVLHDAGSHAVDLVAHVAGKPIRRVRAGLQGDKKRSCLIHIEAELEGGVIASCTIGHAPRYEEYLSVDATGRTYAVDTSGRSGLAQLKMKGSLALRKLTSRPTPTDASFRAQLAAFAAACRGRTGDAGADAQAGLAAVAVIETCIESLARGGVWCDLNENRPTEASV